MASDLDEDLMVAEEVGEVLRLKPSTVYQAAADGRIPCVRLWEGRRRAVIRFRRRDIEEFLRRRTTSPASGESR